MIIIENIRDIWVIICFFWFVIVCDVFLCDLKW